MKRKEIWLADEVIDRLQIIADRKHWSLKQYMETVLVKDSNKVLAKSKLKNK